MARPLEPSAPESAAFRGEVWTAGRLLPPIEYELRDLEPSGSARVTAELEDGRFTIATDQPHVKVAWRIRGRRPNGREPQREEEEHT
jgi:hypothetical protein